MCDTMASQNPVHSEPVNSVVLYLKHNDEKIDVFVILPLKASISCADLSV